MTHCGAARGLQPGFGPSAVDLGLALSPAPHCPKWGTQLSLCSLIYLDFQPSRAGEFLRAELGLELSDVTAEVESRQVGKHAGPKGAGSRPTFSQLCRLHL